MMLENLLGIGVALADDAADNTSGSSAISILGLIIPMALMFFFISL